MKTQNWDRIRLHVNLDDYRPVIWPPLGPYWCSGSNDEWSIVVAYIPHGTSDAEIRKYWPETPEVDRMQEDTTLEYSDRFPKPEWWAEMEAKP